MIPALLGKKIGMTRIFDEKGEAVPVTVVQAGPCTVMQIRNRQRDGYDAVQLGFGDTKPHRSTLPAIGHARKGRTTPKRMLREIRLEQQTELAEGDVVNVGIFTQNNVKYVDICGVSKGSGFTGVMARYGFGGQPNSHGCERKHRSPGSIGGHCSSRGRTGGPKKGKRMAGQTGHENVTIKNQRLMKVDEGNNLLLIEGGIPGPNGGLVMVRKAKSKP